MELKSFVISRALKAKQKQHQGSDGSLTSRGPETTQELMSKSNSQILIVNTNDRERSGSFRNQIPKYKTNIGLFNQMKRDRNRLIMQSQGVLKTEMPYMQQQDSPVNLALKLMQQP